MSICHIPISLGELYDKYSILLIKSKKITNEQKLIEINKEISFLKPFIDKFSLNDELCEKIKLVNEKLWNIKMKLEKRKIKMSLITIL